jgi:outer membrane lipoprotein SlyB/Ca2+-binding EF-hand superfamily protein
MKSLSLLLVSAMLFLGAPLASAAEEAWVVDFRRADLNDSGGLSRVELEKTGSAQLQQVRNNFDAIDADRDGQATADEYRRYLVRVQDDFAVKFRKADVNDSGGLSRRELKKLSGIEFDFIAANFDAMDDDRDGQVTYAEFKNFQARMPAPAAATEVPGTPRDMCKIDCGAVVAVNRYKVKGEDGTMGAIAGGVVGGLLGNQIGKGSGKTVATVAGVAGGAYAGNQIQKQSGSKQMVKVTVKFDTGPQRDYEFEGEQSPYPMGSRVQLRGGQLMQYTGP